MLFFAFSNMISKILAGLNDDEHIFVAFDTGAKTFRHLDDDTYKANRKPAPEPLVVQFPIAREFLNALNIFTFELNGYEADDLPGRLLKSPRHKIIKLKSIRVTGIICS